MFTSFVCRTEAMFLYFVFDMNLFFSNKTKHSSVIFSNLKMCDHVDCDSSMVFHLKDNGDVCHASVYLCILSN